MDIAGDLPELDVVEQRVIGSLLEKERTVPASYPMTLNSLRTACNQSSSRDPIVTYDDATIVDAIDRLKARGLARMVYATSGARAVKYRQVIDEVIALEPDALALITVLLLRGAQAPGELKTRTERLHRFAGREAVEACLGQMADGPQPLVREVERVAGQHDNRWVHLLGPVEVSTVAPAAPKPAMIDREVGLAEGFEQLPFGGATPDPGSGPDLEPAPMEPEPVVDPPAPVPAPTAPRSFQASAGIQGRQFAEQCDTLLAHYGYELKGRRILTEIGVEIDQEAIGPNGTLVWFEYKGSVQGNRPGLRRTDTLKKAIANGALLRSLADPAPYVVVTSHLPEAGSGAAMLDAALRLRYFADVVCLYDTKATARLSAW